MIEAVSIPTPRRSFIARVKDAFDWTDYKCERVGTTDARWMIWPGCMDTVLSAGIGAEVGFELALMRHCVRVIAYDPSDIAYCTVLRQARCMHFHEAGIAGRDGARRFDKADDGGWREGTRHTAHCMTIRSVVAEHDIDPAKFIVKLNIEGFEYEALHRMLSDGIRPRQILVSFHDRWQGIPTLRTALMVARLMLNGYWPYAKRRSAWTFGLRREYGW